MSVHEPRRADIGIRLRAGLVALGSLAVLGIAAGLEASDEGIGTHTQLGMPPCMFREATGYPCMTCGMTTSFSHAAAFAYSYETLNFVPSGTAPLYPERLRTFGSDADG